MFCFRRFCKRVCLSRVKSVSMTFTLLYVRVGGGARGAARWGERWGSCALPHRPKSVLALKGGDPGILFK